MAEGRGRGHGSARMCSLINGWRPTIATRASYIWLCTLTETVAKYSSGTMHDEFDKLNSRSQKKHMNINTKKTIRKQSNTRTRRNLWIGRRWRHWLSQMQLASGLICLFQGCPATATFRVATEACWQCRMITYYIVTSLFMSLSTPASCRMHEPYSTSKLLESIQKRALNIIFASKYCSFVKTTGNRHCQTDATGSRGSFSIQSSTHPAS